MVLWIRKLHLNLWHLTWCINFIFPKQEKKFEAGDMTEWVKTPASNPSYLSSVLRPIWLKERTKYCKLFPDRYTCSIAHTCIQSQWHIYVYSTMAHTWIHSLWLIHHYGTYMYNITMTHTCIQSLWHIHIYSTMAHPCTQHYGTSMYTALWLWHIHVYITMVIHMFM